MVGRRESFTRVIDLLHDSVGGCLLLNCHPKEALKKITFMIEKNGVPRERLIHRGNAGLGIDFGTVGKR